MNEVWDQGTWLEQGTSREMWTARYEQLRAGGFSQEIGWEQALFIRQGAAAWMKAWSTATRSESATRPDDTAPERGALQAAVIGGERQRELTRALANLILHRQQEVFA